MDIKHIDEAIDNIYFFGVIHIVSALLFFLIFLGMSKYFSEIVLISVIVFSCANIILGSIMLQIKKSKNIKNKEEKVNMVILKLRQYFMGFVFLVMIIIGFCILFAYFPMFPNDWNGR